VPFIAQDNTGEVAFSVRSYQSSKHTCSKESLGLTTLQQCFCGEKIFTSW